MVNGAEKVYDNKFLKVYKLDIGEGRGYMDASRRDSDELVATMDEEAYRKMLPDAVSMCMIVNVKGKEPKLYLTKEFRYAANHYLLSPPAGLIDKEDRCLPREEAVIVTAKREAFEETGVEITDKDEVRLVSPLLFSSPGIMDESNAIALVVLNRDEDVDFTHDEAVGLESFGDFSLVTREEAKRLLVSGTDGEGGFFSVFTWIALSVFVSGLWE